MARRITLVAFAFLGLLFVAHLARQWILPTVAQRATRVIGERIDADVRFDEARWKGMFSACLHGIRVSRAQILLATTKRVCVRIDPGSLLDGSPRPEQIQIQEPVLHLKSSGTPRGLAQAVSEILPQRTSGLSSSASKTIQKGPLPEVWISEGAVLDHDGFLRLVEGHLRFHYEKLTGRFLLKAPSETPCRFEGDPQGVQLRCEHPLRLDLPNQLEIEAQELSVTRSPEPKLRLPAIRVTATDPKGLLELLTPGLSMDLSVNLMAGEWGRRPVELRLGLPGAGEMVGRGFADANGLDISAAVKDLELTEPGGGVQGRFSGQYALRIDRLRRTVMMEGEGRVTGLVIQHPALAEAAVGPFSLRLGGRVSGALGEESGVNIKVEDGLFGLGEISARFEGQLEGAPGHMKLVATVETDAVEAQAVANAVPVGLMPHLQPIEATGRLRGRVHLEIDEANLQDTVLDFDVDVKNVKVQSMNSAIDFDGLRQRFETRFEMPPEKEGDEAVVITNETGPFTARWHDLDEIHPLLPLAVITQEDGGFYKHGGISTYHLRGSLVNNLESGRFVRGGSTVTMQAARNLFLNRKKNLARKLEELLLAWLLDGEFEKGELMALYLNVVEFGPNLFGVGDAAAHYFQKLPYELTPAEIGWLVRLLPSPRPLYAHFKRGRLTRGHARSINRLLRLLVKRGHLAEGDYVALGEDDLWAHLSEEKRRELIESIGIER